MNANQKSDRSLAVLNRVKELENMGYQFEGAEASVHLLILYSTRGYCPPFQVLDYSARAYDQNIDSAIRILTHARADESTARATIKVRTLNYNDEGTSSSSDFSYIENLEVSDGIG